MKLGIISDVHGNLPALDVVLSELNKKGISKILHAGDVVGYNPWPNEVIERFVKHNIVSILGNHDRAVITGDTSFFNPAARNAVYWTIGKLSDNNYAYLKSLHTREKIIVDNKKICIIHGSPWDDDEYVYTPTSEFLDATNANIVIYGHTHVSVCKVYENGIVFNPGSVGQPRDGNPRASYGVIDTTENTAEIFKVKYDIHKVIEQIENENLPSELGYRLLLGM